MPSATQDYYHVNPKLPRIHTAYQVTNPKPSPAQSPISTTKQTTMPTGPSRELPMPIVSRIASLGQAQATLQHCAAKLSKSWQNNPGRASPPGTPIDTIERRHFQQWLEQWEQAFTAYLSRSMAGMKSEDVTRCRILKANHLSCTILASGGGLDPKAYNSFEADFQAIVGLASAVIESRPRSDTSSSSESPVDFNPTASVLDVQDPLFVVVARCDRASIRNHAIELLRKINPH